MMLTEPSLEYERTLVAGAPLVGMDEVGRGALAGPVAVGACLAGEGPLPPGLRDSKMLTARRRQQLFLPVTQWARAIAVGMASASEIDALGISGALRLAGIRALEVLVRMGVNSPAVLLDGSHDWLNAGADLFTTSALPGSPSGYGGDGCGPVREAVGADLTSRLAALRLRSVTTEVKADGSCASVAAASVAAKVVRDNLMATLPDPGYGFAQHKGYGSSAHRQALRQLGASPIHRLTWNLGVGVKVDKR